MNDKYAIIEVPTDQKGEDLLDILLSNGLSCVTITSDLRNSALRRNSVISTTVDEGNNGLDAADSMNRRYFYYVIDYEANNADGYANLYVGPIHKHPSIQVRLLGQQPQLSTHTQQPDDVRLVSDADIERRINELIPIRSGSSNCSVILLLIDEDDENVETSVMNEAETLKSEEGQKVITTIMEANEKDNQVPDVDSTDEWIDATENQGPTAAANNQVLEMATQDDSVDPTTNHRETTTSVNNPHSESSVKECRADCKQTTITDKKVISFHSGSEMMYSETGTRAVNTVPYYVPPSLRCPPVVRRLHPNAPPSLRHPPVAVTIGAGEPTTYTADRLDLMKRGSGRRTDFSHRAEITPVSESIDKTDDRVAEHKTRIAGLNDRLNSGYRLRGGGFGTRPNIAGERRAPSDLSTHSVQRSDQMNSFKGGRGGRTDVSHRADITHASESIDKADDRIAEHKTRIAALNDQLNSGYRFRGFGLGTRPFTVKERCSGNLSTRTVVNSFIGDRGDLRRGFGGYSSGLTGDFLTGGFEDRAEVIDRIEKTTVSPRGLESYRGRGVSRRGCYRDISIPL